MAGKYTYLIGFVGELLRKRMTLWKNSYCTLKEPGIESKLLFQTICYVHLQFPKKDVFDLAFTDEWPLF